MMPDLRRRWTKLGALLWALLAAGCAAPQRVASPWDPEAELAKIEKINVTNGIRYAEARTLTEAYFGTFLSGCGFAEGPRRHHGVWRSRARVGFAGELLPGAIEVDARTGAIGFPGCPVFRTLEEFRDAVERAQREPSEGLLPCWVRNRMPAS
jgi:hypothetical protein